MQRYEVEPGEWSEALVLGAEMMSIPGIRKEREVLFSFGDWCIIRYTDNDQKEFVYAEHHTGCTGEYDKALAYWSWEHTDENTHCWECEIECPEEVRGLVVLYNFNDMGG